LTGDATPGRVADFYDDFWSGNKERHYQPEPALESLIFKYCDADTDVLDVGCGSGNSYAPGLAARGSSYVGVDVAENAVQAARREGLDARTIDDAASLPFADDSFDLVVCVEVLEHLLSPDGAATEIRRVLRPGGRLVASTPNLAYWRMRANALVGLWNPLGDELSMERPWRDPHIRFFTMATLQRMLSFVGFRDVEIGAHGGRFIDHATSRATGLGQGRLYGRLEPHFPSLLGLTLHAVALK
jgi:methionine biosynthesis protein MetW